MKTIFYEHLFYHCVVKMLPTFTITHNTEFDLTYTTHWDSFSNKNIQQLPK